MICRRWFAVLFKCTSSLTTNSLPPYTVPLLVDWIHAALPGTLSSPPAITSQCPCMLNIDKWSVPDPDPEPYVFGSPGSASASSKNDVIVPWKRNKHKHFFIGILMVTEEKSRIQSRIRIRTGSTSGSVSQKYGSEDPHPHPDLYQKVTDPEHWINVVKI